ncbi:peptide deformylase [Lacticaseibacillus daqingensis]|uniref:peptide deformylase n=1 Tax=Lacticaseibacillus daqingensis TaxID=2486014 RepID=UPI000F78B6B5|nr:peptide deformylase [Lacticaseibacillus daqingensis]
MIRAINRDQTLLARPSRLATPKDAAVIQDLKDTLAANRAGCVGMAANMIGVSVRAIIVAMGPLNVPMVNPVITAKTGPYQTQEGCLSLLGERPTTRYETVTVHFLTEQFQPQTQTFTGFVAQIIQHEVDHCEGIVI